MEGLSMSSGHVIPPLGMGTWQHTKSYPEEVTDAVVFGIKSGVRHIDCAFIYKNEAEVGQAFQRVFDEKVVTRKELFITSKLWSTEHHPDDVRAACEKSLKDLGLDYLDSYLIHWPSAFIKGHGNVPVSEFDGVVQYANIHFMDTWRAMEGLVDAGLVRSIGMSNFNPEQMSTVIENCRIKPSILQVECNPRMTQEPLRKFCEANGVRMVAYSPFGSPDLPWGATNLPHILADETLVRIGKEHGGRSPAQVVLRWLIQRGIAAIPKSVIKSEILDNLKCSEFTLTADQMSAIGAMNKNIRKIVPTIKLKDGRTVRRDGMPGDAFFPFAAEFKE